MGVHRKESRKQGTDDVQINKSLSTIAVNMTAQMTETALSHKATNASVHRRRRNDYDDIYKWQEEEYEEDDEEEMKEYLVSSWHLSINTFLLEWYSFACDCFLCPLWP